MQLSDPQEIVNAFKQAEQAELVGVRQLRATNAAATRWVHLHHHLLQHLHHQWSTTCTSTLTTNCT